MLRFACCTIVWSVLGVFTKQSHAPEREAGMKALIWPVRSDGMKKQAQVMVDSVFSFGELGFQEFETTKYLTGILEKEGFKIRARHRGHPYRVHGELGRSGKPVIAGLGSDIDDIPQASQKARRRVARTPHRRRTRGDGEGHNSGVPLNILAALAVKQIMEREHLKGTIKLWPGVAEELLGTKAFYVRAGIFKDVDIVLFAHVGSNLGVAYGPTSNNGSGVGANTCSKGKAAHAAGASTARLPQRIGCCGADGRRL